MKTHDLIQGSEPWLVFRSRHFGASEAAAMLGLSKTGTRTELLRLKKFGVAKEYGDWFQRNVLNKGHEIEEQARRFVEQLIGESLYSVTCSDGELSASCDGLSMGEDIAWECKTRNAENWTLVNSGKVPPEHMPQCQQVLMVTGASGLIFTVSDGTREGTLCTNVRPDPEWFARLRAGWKQFAEDLVTFETKEAESEVIGRSPETLPALRIEVTGAVTASNLAQYREHALEVFAAINRDLKTDQDFANADKTVKWCGDVEDRLKAAKQHALSQTESIDALFRTIDDITAEARSTRLELSKLVTARKDARKAEIVAGASTALRDHVLALHERTGGLLRYPTTIDFGMAVKNLRTIESMQNAVDTALAHAKISTNEQADRIDANLKTIRSADHGVLFPDLSALVLKAPDDLAAVIAHRIAEHEKAIEAARVKAEEARAASAVTNEPARPTAAPAVIRSGVDSTGAGFSTVEPPTLTLGQIGSRLGFTLSAAFIADALGIQAAGRAKAAVLFHATDFDRICAALVEHIEAVALPAA